MEDIYRLEDLHRDHLFEELAIVKQLINQLPYSKGLTVPLYYNPNEIELKDEDLPDDFTRYSEVLERFNRIGIIKSNENDKDLIELGVFLVTVDEKKLKEYKGLLVKQIEKLERDDKTQGWGWIDKLKGRYQLGGKEFEQNRGARKDLFRIMMELFEKNQGFYIHSLKEATGIDSSRLRIEISAINKRLKKETGYYFKGSGKGFYTLEN